MFIKLIKIKSLWINYDYIYSYFISRHFSSETVQNNEEDLYAY